MKVVKVIESKVWKHTSGRTASIYGAVPWTGAFGNARSDWEMVTVGFTWLNDNGTVGLCRVPVKTREEAEEVMCQVNKRHD